MQRSVILFVNLLLFSACIPRAIYLDRAESRPQQIAVLPTINQTTDVKGGIVLRNVFFEALEDRHYAQLIDPQYVDSLLNEEGITDGGQLKLVDNADLCNILSVDGLIYLDLIECEYQTLGISETRKVCVNAKLYKKPSILLWEDQQEKDKGKSIFDTIADVLDDPKDALKETAEDFGEQLGRKGSRMWLMNHELRPEMDSVIADLLQTLR